jgi:N-acetylglucosaminyl-diphospho-decaprenol L-rhamnosyltransferase
LGKSTENTRIKVVKLCAVILNYFGHEETITCINRLRGQSLAKIVVLENSGSEKERQVLTAAFTKAPIVEVISSKKNLGFAGGVNYVLKQMIPYGFDAFLVMNNDTLPPSDMIDTLTKGAETLSLDLASPVIYHHPEQYKLWSKGNHYNKWTGLLTSKPLSLLPGDFFYLTGCCLLVRTKVFEALGFLDEDFFMYGEDAEFCFRAAQKGFKTGIVPAARTYHKTGSSAVHNSFFYEYHINRSHFLLAHKLFLNFYSRLFAQALKTILLGMRAIMRTLRYKNLNALKGYLQARRKVPIVWKL